ncbi:MAG: tetratricopeptide repeat protein [Elusimicrobia bacterium]|nr:tetratricopeptide repeat protein [Elusimicrobiota bacterium]
MNHLKVFVLIPTAFILSGCVATQHDMLQMQSQMDDLNSSLANMQKNQADLAIKMDDLSQNLNSFSENMDDVSKQISAFNDNLRLMDSNIGSKVSKLGQNIQKQQDEVKSDLLPTKIYNDAYSSMLNKNYDSAVYGFKKYISKFPDDELVKGAYYNLGESLYAKKEWKEAAISYANLLDKYPEYFRVPSARIKYALAILKLPENKKEEALKYLESVVKDYPNSKEATLAKKHISELNKKPENTEPSSKEKNTSK